MRTTNRKLYELLQSVFRGDKLSHYFYKVLMAEGYIQRTPSVSVPAKKGRPSFAYSLTDKGLEFIKTYERF